MTKLSFFKKEGFRPRFLAIVCVVQALHFAGSIHAFAHQGERIFPIYEITDDMLELIDLDDGRIDEWEELFEPSITTLDFTRKIFDRNTSREKQSRMIPPTLISKSGWFGTTPTTVCMYRVSSRMIYM